MENKVTKVIKSRVSCREYSEKKVPNSKLDEILECGKMAPSGMNRQIANIVCLRSKTKVEKLRKLSISIRGKDCYYGANTIILVHAPKDDKFTFQDCTCVIENMMIAAASMNINSCWINQSDELLNSPQGLKLKKIYGIPEDDMIVGSVIVGYAKDTNSLSVKPRKENFIRKI